jgi:hypothetical protein
MEYVIGLLLGILGSLIAAEIFACGPVIARSLIGLAVRRLPEEDRNRFREEWLSHLQEMPGFFSMISHALGCNRSKIRRELEMRRAQKQSAMPAGAPAAKNNGLEDQSGASERDQLLAMLGSHEFSPKLKARFIHMYDTKKQTMSWQEGLEFIGLLFEEGLSARARSEAESKQTDRK